MATEVSLILVSVLLFLAALVGLPLLYLQLCDHCIKYNIKKESRLLKLRHEASNLRDVRFLSNMAVENHFRLNNGESDVHLRYENLEGPLATSDSTAAPEPAVTKPVIAEKPKTAQIRRVGRVQNMAALLESGQAEVFKKPTEAVAALKAGKRILAEAAVSCAKSRAELVKKV